MHCLKSSEKVGQLPLEALSHPPTSQRRDVKGDHAEPEAEAWDHGVTDLPMGRLQSQPLSDCSHREDSSENHPAESSACGTMQCYRKFRVVATQSVSSVAQSCLTLCHPMDCSMPGFPVHHQFPELAQTHVHQVGDAIQPSHTLSSPSLPAFNLSQPQGLFQSVISLYQVAEVLELQLYQQCCQ